MPIYAYKCESCGFAKDVLQKMSDTPLSVCPHCQAASFKKQLTAAGFQLKGSGWYVTDFRGGNNGAPGAKTGDPAAAAPGVDKSADSATPAAPAATSTAATVATPAAPASQKTSGDASPKSS